MREIGLYLATLNEIMPLFALYDQTDYLGWCSIYLYDMQNLKKSALHVYTALWK